MLAVTQANAAGSVENWTVLFVQTKKNNYRESFNNPKNDEIDIKNSFRINIKY